MPAPSTSPSVPTRPTSQTLERWPLAANAPAIGITTSVPTGMPTLPAAIKTKSAPYPAWSMNEVASWTRCSTLARYPPHAPNVAPRRQRLGGGAAAFRANRVEERHRFNLAVADRLLG